MYIFPPFLGTKLSTYTLPNFSNIVYQFTLPQRGTTLCTYFPAPIEPKLCTFTLPNITNIVFQLTYPTRYYIMYIFHPSHRPKIVYLYPSNFSNIVYQSTPPQRGTTLCTYFPPPIDPNCVLIPSPILVILCTNLSYLFPLYH